MNKNFLKTKQQKTAQNEALYQHYFLVREKRGSWVQGGKMWTQDEIRGGGLSSPTSSSFSYSLSVSLLPKAKEGKGFRVRNVSHFCDVMELSIRVGEGRGARIKSERSRRERGKWEGEGVKLSRGANYIIAQAENHTAPSSLSLSLSMFFARAYVIWAHELINIMKLILLYYIM